MRFVVAGGAGFIGSAVVRHPIAALSHEVVCSRQPIPVYGAGDIFRDLLSVEDRARALSSRLRADGARATRDSCAIGSKNARHGHPRPRLRAVAL